MAVNDKVYSINEIKEKLTILLKKENNHYNINTIILFGSYARSEADKTSDIDFLVINSPLFYGIKTYGFNDKIRKLFKKNVDLVIDRNIDNSSKFYKNIMKDGIIIYEQN